MQLSKEDTTFISRQAAIEALGEEPIVWSNDNDYELGARNQWRLDKSAIEATSSADVVEVVLCKDCKHYYFAENRIPQEQRYVCDLDGDRWNPDSFCSFAERRTDEQIH